MFNNMTKTYATQRAKEVSPWSILSKNDYFRMSDTYYCGPCPVCGGNDRFTIVMPGKKANHPLYNCRKCHDSSDGHYYDNIELVGKMTKLRFLEVVEFLVGREVDTNAPFAKPKKVLEKQMKLPTHEWSNAMWEALQAMRTSLEAEYDLGGDTANYLEGRGIDQALAEQFSIGLNPKWRTVRVGSKEDDLVKIPPSIVFPTFSLDGRLVKLNCRFLEGYKPTESNRYMIVRGSSMDFPFRNQPVNQWRDVIVLEGELDCMIASRGTGNLFHCITFGSANAQIPTPFHNLLKKANSIILAFDNDAAGREAALNTARLYKDAKIAIGMVGKDISEHYLQLGYHSVGRLLLLGKASELATLAEIKQMS